MTTLKNTFHSTAYKSRKSEDEIYLIGTTPPWNRTPAEKAFVRRIWRQLCGIKGCQCGDEFGRREEHFENI